MEKIRVIISGGGTGGHVFPAIAIANAIKARYKNAQILFVGANGRMEMHKVPEAGYEIVGLDVAGLNRRQPWKNVSIKVDVSGEKIIERVQTQYRNRCWWLCKWSHSETS